MKTRKVGIIGAGNVGTHVASNLAALGICDEIIMLDEDREKCFGQVMDLQDAEGTAIHNCKIMQGNYDDFTDADILVISVCGKVFDENRLHELDESLRILDEIVPKIQKCGFHGMILSITNPCDLVTYYLTKKLPQLTVLGTGTGLDSNRFRVRIAQKLGIHSSAVQGFTLGEHGDSQVPVWSQVRIYGQLMENLPADMRIDNIQQKEISLKTIRAGWEIASRKKCTEFGIAMVAAHIIQAIYNDAKIVMPCSTFLRGEYGQENLCVSVPCTIGKNGVERIWELELTTAEKEKFQQSCDLLKNLIKAKL